MTTDDLTKTITKFTVANGRGPNSIQELQQVLVTELKTAISDADLVEELNNAMQAGLVSKDGQGTLQRSSRYQETTCR